jgi:hypothetical protein
MQNPYEFVVSSFTGPGSNIDEPCGTDAEKFVGSEVVLCGAIIDQDVSGVPLERSHPILAVTIAI